MMNAGARERCIEDDLGTGSPLGIEVDTLVRAFEQALDARGVPFAVVEAVDGRAEVLLDGGVRRGGDVVKALALGARAVMIGRPYLWGLAADGQAGVENVLDVLRSGIDSALLGLGRTSVHDLVPSDLLIPDGFSRRLGA